MQQWTEGIHYYFNKEGLIVLTAQFHLERGHCCGNGCLHCPYDFMNVKEPRRSALRKQREESSRNETTGGSGEAS